MRKRQGARNRIVESPNSFQAVGQWPSKRNPADSLAQGSTGGLCLGRNYPGIAAFWNGRRNRGAMQLTRQGRVDAQGNGETGFSQALSQRAGDACHNVGFISEAVRGDKPEKPVIS